MQKISLLLPIIIVLLSSCKGTNIDKNGFIPIILFDNSPGEESIDTMLMKIEKTDKNIFVYQRKLLAGDNNPFELTIDLNKDFQSSFQIMSKVGESNDYFVVGTMSYKALCNNKYYRIYRILRNSKSIDGDGLLFWTPEFGIILEKSLTWRGSRRTEIMNDNVSNCIIRDLCYGIMADKEFYFPNSLDKYLE